MDIQLFSEWSGVGVDHSTLVIGDYLAEVDLRTNDGGYSWRVEDYDHGSNHRGVSETLSSAKRACESKIRSWVEEQNAFAIRTARVA